MKSTPSLRDKGIGTTIRFFFFLCLLSPALWVKGQIGAPLNQQIKQIPAIQKQALTNERAVDLVLPAGHMDVILGLDYSEDGRCILSFAKDGQVKVWDAQTGFEQGVYTATEPIKQAIFLPNSSLIAIIESNYQLTLWDWSSQSVQDQLPLYSLVLSMLAYDQQTLLLGAMDGKIYCFNLVSKQMEAAWPIYTSPVSALAKLDDGRILSGSLEGDLTLWAGLRMPAVIDYTGQSGEVAAIAYHGYHDFFYTIDGSAVKKWSVAKDDLLVEMCSTDEDLRGLAISSDGQYLVGGGNDFWVYVWKVLDREYDELVSKRDGHQNWISDVALSPDGLKMATSSWDESILLWDINFDQAYRRISRLIDEMLCMDIDAKGRELLVGTKEGDIRIIDLSTGRQQTVYDKHSSWLTDLCFSSDQQYILSASLDNSIKLTPVGEPDSTVVFKYGGEEGIRQVEFLGAGTEQFLFSTKYQLYQGQFLGKEIKWGPRFYKEINDLIWMASQEQALVLSNSTAYLLDASGMLIDSLVTSHLLSQVAIAPSADRALIASWGRSIYAWDLDNTKQYEVYTAHDGSVSAVAFKEDGQQFVSADTRGELLLWEWGQSRPRRRIRLHQQAIRALRFQGTQVISIGEDFKLKLLHVPTWKEMATYIPFQEEQFLTILPNNYYSASNQRALFENAGFVLQDQIYPLQYIDPQLNRPQEVLRAMLYPNPLLNGVFQQAYEQRLKTLGIVHSDQLRIEIPRVELVGIERLPGITKHKKIELNVTALDLSWGLKSLTVEINNVPQFRFDCSPSKKYLRKKIEVDLARGQNRIEVYANNAKGVRSFPKSIDLQCLNGPSSPKLYLLAIGADQYVHPTLRPLEYPDQDAKKIAELFESGNHYFQDIHLRTLTGEQVTEANIFAAIDAFAQAQADDVLMLVYSGHGLLDKTSNLHLGTYDARFIQGELEQGLPFARLESRLSQLKPHRKLLMLDACFTGVPDQTLKGATEGENASSASADELTDKSPFPLMDPSVLSKQLFVDLSENNYGINVLASTGANAYSYEGSKWSGSVFIGYLIEGLKKGQADENGDGMIFLPELMLYLKREVKEETNGVQSPDWRSKNTLLKFQVW